ncbi:MULTISPECIES: hypothetical protein [unclassified Cryobacterium]|uniref:hypothetical protein n=1 Tax=unclassified Cryobacterium TaxID=2649013 RepID=UPI0010699EBF|nr:MULTISPECIES: hypothetical protein [unclassified Cryobacterium]TFC59456.1 hypothetical protein E3O68_00725 [Cryobacterium sp. TMB3-1-2]TFC67252.1 hypothetical protein E3T21_17420 [Cryobacterium sp. TMB3-15]TFC73235.1 hypothetical protein E3T22_16635 [Cryobacterium sp. TMB3-10]TFD46123.1 hypothetical protein E3T58_01270 [Cryobacterium sp. TMB3-12]
MTTVLPLENFTGWLANGERGVSSEAMVSHLTGANVGRRYGGGDHPYDPSDFRRCEMLLRRVELARLVLPQMATRSPEWAALVAHWEELVTLAESEVPGIFDTDRARGAAPLTYKRMKDLFAEATKKESK